MNEKNNRIPNPIGFIYSVRTSDIQAYVEEYLEAAGIKVANEINAVYVKSYTGGTMIRPSDINVYLFLPQNSRLVKSSTKNIPDKIKQRLENVGVNITNEFREIITPIAGRKIEIGRQNGEIYIKLNINMVLASYLDIDPRKETVGIISIGGERNNIFEVVSKLIPGGNKKSGNNDDKYDRMVRNINHRD